MAKDALRKIYESMLNEAITDVWFNEGSFKTFKKPLDEKYEIASQDGTVETLEGPVVIYAGAGSGKTRALTYRIANGVLNKLFDPTKVLALSFTTRAADEMALRLASLGIRNVATRTFHSAALRQLKYFWPIAIGGTMPIIIENKYKVLDTALKNKKLKIREVISEIEFAKTNRMDPESLSNLDFADAYQDYINFTDKNNLIFIFQI